MFYKGSLSCLSPCTQRACQRLCVQRPRASVVAFGHSRAPAPGPLPRYRPASPWADGRRARRVVMLPGRASASGPGSASASAPPPPPPPPLAPQGVEGWASYILSRASLVLTHAAFVYVFAFLFDDPLGTGWFRTIDLAPSLVDAAPAGLHLPSLGVDAGLLLLWAAQHSGMARSWFKRRVWGPEGGAHPLERPVYSLVSVVLFVSTCVFWAPPFPSAVLDLHTVAPWRWAVAVPLMGAAGATIVGFMWLLPDHICGTARFERAKRGQEPPPPPQVLYTWPYSMVRHPSNAAVLWLLAAVAVVGTPNHAAYSALWAAYIAWGTGLEERGCEEEFGAAYDTYRGRVGMFFPRAEWVRGVLSRQS